ncbi:NLR family CARD domain-containing protein 4 [Spea bombifrons]|uniref:NLR family CARD domain-containing protein 4 n=1 Tax=Spea bombifrons TaxID=233779 RepID=UPI00234A3A17|nr:NLR family CARD domain-containing protein 4 [Spea bombifrons]
MDLIRAKFLELTQRLGRCVATQIVGKFFAMSILSMEEMDFILTAKTDSDVARELVTMIFKKGEESCRYFLKLLENLDGYLFRDIMGQNALDGTHRVTKEDLDQLAQYLKDLYLSPLFLNFHPLGEETDIDILFDLRTTFTDPLLWEKNTLNRRKGHLTLTEALNKLRSPCIVEGEAGKGKTTILKRIAVLWAQECEALENYKLVFFVTLRGTKEGLYETLQDQLFSVTSKWNKKEFMEEIWKLGKKVLFLLDGYDEFQSDSCEEIEELIKQNPKFNSTIIVSTRTETIGKVRKYGSLIVETSDFTEESAKQLIESVLESDEAAGLLLQLKESIFIKNLMKTPLFVVIACALRMGERDFQMNTQTALFCALYELMVERGNYKTRKIKKNIVEENIKRCGDLALQGLFDHRFDFLEEHLSGIKEKVLLDIGLLNKYTAQRHKPTYRFFHKSFQEYIAGRRLSQLLSSPESSDVIRGRHYLNKMDSVWDISNTYSNLLLYTCGSSKSATQTVLNHIVAVCNNNVKDCGTELVEFGVNLFFESSTKTELSPEFESFFSSKHFYIHTNNISSHHFEFFKHLPNCLSVLDLIKLELFGFPSNDRSSENKGNTLSNVGSTYIPDKAVRLFFDWNQTLQTLEVTLKGFDKLNKQDIKYLSKICCSAKLLRLNIKRSPGITGALTSVLESCKNMQELIVDHTPLCSEDEKQITGMTAMKALSISNVQLQQQPDGLLCGLCKLVNIEKICIQNTKMSATDTKILAKGLEKLTKLKILNLSHLFNIENGMEDIVQSISFNCPQLEELKLCGCCLTGKALLVLSRNLRILPKIEILDLSENYLLEDGSESVADLVNALNNLPLLREILLPGGIDLKLCLDALLHQLKRMPRLSKLAITSWNLADEDMVKLASHFSCGFENLSYLDLSNNCASSEGWIVLLDVFPNLKTLSQINFSTEKLFTPDSVLVSKLSCTISDLKPLCTVHLDNWELDHFDVDRIKRAKNMVYSQVKEGGHSFQAGNIEDETR